MFKIQPLKKSEINKAAKIASQCFNGLKNIKKAEKWISCNFQAYPRTKYFTAKENNKIAGYILWIEKGGFRKQAVLELEQIAVYADCRGKGVGAKLIEESLKKIKNDLRKRGSELKAIEVTTGRENKAQGLYKKTLGAEPEAVIKNLFSGDEVIMLARF